MKKIIKKVLKETLEDKKLREITVRFNNYVKKLEERVGQNGILLISQTGKDVKIWIRINKLDCIVDETLWDKLSMVFNLSNDEIKLFLSNWIEDTYGFKDFRIRLHPPNSWPIEPIEMF